MVQYKHPRHGQDGFSLATVMLIALAVILGSIAMIDRATSGWLGSLFVGQSREARDAAEIGLTRVVSQLNRSRNRRLLVNAAALSSKTIDQLEAKTPDFTSYCEEDGPELSKKTGSLGEFTQGEIIAQGEQSIPGGTNDLTERRYRVVSITQPTESQEYNPDLTKNPSFAVKVSPPKAGSLTIVVEGIIRRGNTVVARSRISETLAVVPKCCRRSYSGSGESSAFGNDSRECDWPPAGIMVGMSQDATNPGGLIAKGTAVDFNAEHEDDPLPYVLCVGTCNNEVNANNPTEIKNNSTLRLPNIEALTTNGICDKDSEEYDDTTTCDISLNDIPPEQRSNDRVVLNRNDWQSWPAVFKNVCQPAEWKDVNKNGTEDPGETDTNAIHCSINKLDFGANGRTIEFDTTAGPIRIHFPNPQSPDISIKTIDQRNNGAFSHSGEVVNLSLLGCTEAECLKQYVDLGSGNSGVFNLFAYFRNGIVNIGGDAGYNGVLWANKIVANGNVDFNVPDGAVISVLDLLRMNSPGIDWVARSVKSKQLFSP